MKTMIAFGLATVLARFAKTAVKPASFWYVYNGETPDELLK